MKKDKKFLEDLALFLGDSKYKEEIISKYDNLIKSEKENGKKIKYILKDLGDPEKIANEELKSYEKNNSFNVFKSIKSKFLTLKDKLNNSIENNKLKRDELKVIKESDRDKIKEEKAKLKEEKRIKKEIEKLNKEQEKENNKGNNKEKSKEEKKSIFDKIKEKTDFFKKEKNQLNEDKKKAKEQKKVKKEKEKKKEEKNKKEKSKEEKKNIFNNIKEKIISLRIVKNKEEKDKISLEKKLQKEKIKEDKKRLSEEKRLKKEEEKAKKEKEKKKELKKKELKKKEAKKDKISLIDKFKNVFKKKEREIKVSPKEVVEEVKEDVEDKISDVTEIVSETHVFESKSKRFKRIILKTIGVLITCLLAFVWLWVTVVFFASIFAYLDGIKFIGIVIAAFSVDLLVFWLVIIINRAIFRKKMNLILNLIIIFISLAGIAYGGVKAFKEISAIEYIQDVSDKYTMTRKLETYDLSKDTNEKFIITFNSNYNTQYVISYDKNLKNKVKIETRYYECYYDYYVKTNVNGVYVSLSLDNRDRFSVYLDDIKEGKIYDNDELARYTVKITVNPNDSDRIAIQ